VGSILAEVFLFPVDTVKLIVQTSTMKNGSGFFAVMGNILQEKGIGGFYKGLGAAILKEAVHSFNFWIWHGLLFQGFSHADDTSRTPTSARLVLNLIAKQLNWLCTVPFEVISSVNQLSPDSPGFLSTAVLLYQNQGIGTFYRGLAVSLVLAINPAIMNTLITTFLGLGLLQECLLGLITKTLVIMDLLQLGQQPLSPNLWPRLLHIH